MTLAENNNPFRLAHAALWTLLEANTDFTSLVPSANRLKYTSTSQHYPDIYDVVNKGNCPAVRIIQSNILPTRYSSEGMHYNTSNSSFVTLRFEVQILTGRQSLLDVLDVAWTIYRALVTWTTYLKTNVTWTSKECVSNCTPRETKESLTNHELNRGLRGWTSVWVGDVEMYFTTSDL